MIGINLRAQNLLCICIDTVRGKEAEGRIFTKFSLSPTNFDGIGEMLSKIDDFYDEIGFPQSAVKTRSFSKDIGAVSDKDKLGEVMSAKDLISQKGEKGTFIVNVQYRQNATWQGSVTWCEKDVTKEFRSALELLKLIDSSLDELEM